MRTTCKKRANSARRQWKSRKPLLVALTLWASGQSGEPASLGHNAAARRKSRLNGTGLTVSSLGTERCRLVGGRLSCLSNADESCGPGVTVRVIDAPTPRFRRSTHPRRFRPSFDFRSNTRQCHQEAVAKFNRDFGAAFTSCYERE
jgi:hypothetical protein